MLHEYPGTGWLLVHVHAQPIKMVHVHKPLALTRTQFTMKKDLIHTSQ